MSSQHFNDKRHKSDYFSHAAPQFKNRVEFDTFVSLSKSSEGGVLPWHDSRARMLQCSGCAVLEEDISHCKQKWRGQSNCCSCLRTLCQCQTVCCLDTVHWGLVLGFGNVQKVSWIITLQQPQTEILHCSPLSEIVKDMITSTAACHLWRGSVVWAAADFLAVSFGFRALDTQMGVDKHLQFLRSSGK